jgi:large conductance mechanosensitive channel
MWSEFKAFLLKQNVLALALAVVVGAALNKVVQAVVDNFIMPIVGALTPSGAWEKWSLDVGSMHFGIGAFLSALVNFIIIGFVAWRISKAFIKPEPAAEKPATKNCPYCKMAIDAAATRCPHCTSQLAGVIDEGGMRTVPTGTTVGATPR